MRIIFLNPPYIKEYVRSSRCTWLPIAGSNWYPIFLAYATGYLEKSGHKVKLWDALVEGTRRSDLITGIKNFGANLVVVYTSLDSMSNDVDVIEDIKKNHSCLITVVGPWCAMDPEGLLKSSQAIDAVIRREFDEPVKLIGENKPWSEIPGLVWRQGGKIISNQGDYFLPNDKLESLPFVASIYKKHLNIYNYKQTSLKYPFIDMFTARGCAWGKCTFCLWPQTIQKGAPYRFRSVENVIEEIKYIQKELPKIKEVFFQDDMLPRLRIRQIAEAIINNKLKLTWSGYAKTDLDYETLRLAKKSGCRFLHVGYESSVQGILNAVNKGETIKQMEEFTAAAKKAGVLIHGDFIIGLPGETEETIKKTIAWAKELNISDYQFVVPQPHPATKFYQWLKEHNYLTKEDKVNYPDLDPARLEYWRFKAYREIYLSPKYMFSRLADGLKHPEEMVRLVKVAKKGLPKLFSNKK